jgi:hypothetical protein
MSSFKYPFFVPDFNQTSVFMIDFRKTLISNFVNICPVGVELFHAIKTDGRTNLTKLIVPIRNSANAPKNSAVGLK